MFYMQTWQQALVATVVLGSIGWMSLAIVRLFSRRASGKASAVESALVARTVPQGCRMFDGWAYRVGARFAGRVRIAVYDDCVAVAGPRVPRRLYQLWIWAQALMLALVPAAAAVVALDWRWLVVAIAIVITSFGVSFGCAGLYPGLGEPTNAAENGYFNALDFPRASVRGIDIGKGWSKGGLEVVLFPFKAGVDKMAAGRAVSFFAPDEHGHEVRFAIDVYDQEAARALSDMLATQATGTPV